MEHFIRPTFNPYYPIKKQINYSIYVDERQIKPKIKPRYGQYFVNTFPNYGYNQQRTIDYSGYKYTDKIERKTLEMLDIDTNDTTEIFINKMVDMNRYVLQYRVPETLGGISRALY